MKSAGFTCEASSILKQCRREAFNQGPAAYGLCMGLDMISAGLSRFAERAIELDDDQLLNICQQLCIVKDVTAIAAVEAQDDAADSRQADKVRWEYEQGFDAPEQVEALDEDSQK